MLLVTYMIFSWEYFAGRMGSLKDWISSQLVSMSLVSSRPLSGSDSFFREEPSHEGFDGQGIALPPVLYGYYS